MPPKKEPTNFTLHINPYDGDPSTFKFFAEQLNDVIQINNWSNKQAIAFLKSKLTGSALRYYVDSPELQQVTEFKDLLQELKEFFCPVNSCNLAQNLHSFCMLPSESIKNLSHRLNVLVSQAYPSITDKTALNEIKYNKFLVSIPSEMRIKILENDIKDYVTAVNHAQKLQDISIQNSVVNKINVQDSPDLKSEINAIKIAVEKLSQPSEQINKITNISHPNTNRPKSREYNWSYHRTHYRDNKSNQMYHREKCHFCGKFGHIMKNCNEYNRRQNQRGWSRFQIPRFQNSNSNRQHPN